MFCTRKTHTSNKTIHSKREKLQVFCMVQCVSALTGISLYLFARRVILILIVNVLTLLLALLGHVGSRNLEKTFVGVHAVGTTCGIGGFFLFEMLEVLYTPDSWLLFALSIPYLVDLISGCFSVSLLSSLMEPDSELKENLLAERTNQCVICMENLQEILVYPCGHKCLCVGCSVKLLQPESTCPICRIPVDDLVRIYEI